MTGLFYFQFRFHYWNADDADFADSHRFFQHKFIKLCESPCISTNLCEMVNFNINFIFSR